MSDGNKINDVHCMTMFIINIIICLTSGNVNKFNSNEIKISKMENTFIHFSFSSNENK